MEKQSISINVTLDEYKMPEHIDWTATGAGTLDTAQPAKAFTLSLWDGVEQTAMSINLWTKRMKVDEMNDFLFQTILTLSDTYVKATKDVALADELKEFAANFKKKADKKIREEQTR